MTVTGRAPEADGAGGPGAGAARSGAGARLVVDATVARGGFTVTVGLDVPAGGSVALLGPNGAGKSTLLHALAGLTPLAAGSVRLGDAELEVAGRLRARPEARRIALLDQKPRLFPHLTIAQNIAFGPRSQGCSRVAARRICADWLERIGLADRAGDRPHRLSGGQQQRVAIARAFAARPRVLLLDEPLAALDAETAPQVRRMLAGELARTGVTSVVVTHALADAWQWSDHCVVLDRGAVIDEASPTDLATRPRHPFSAALAGFAVLRGTWTGTGLRVAGGDPGAALVGTVGGAELAGTLGEPRPDVGGPAFGVVAPRDVTVTRRPDGPDADGAAPSGLTARLTAVSVHAGTVRLEAAGGVAAESDFADALRLGGGQLPVVGDAYGFTPCRMRILAMPG